LLNKNENLVGWSLLPIFIGYSNNMHLRFNNARFDFESTERINYNYIYITKQYQKKIYQSITGNAKIQCSFGILLICLVKFPPANDSNTRAIFFF